MDETGTMGSVSSETIFDLPSALWIAVGTAFLVLLTVALIQAVRRKTGFSSAHSNDLLRQISRQLDSLKEIGKQVEGLDRAFRIPRVRGGFGESMLEELLRAWLPPGSWTSQHSFRDGSRVDAVIRTGHYLTPVDSKFPMEQLEKWLGDDEASMSTESRRVIVNHARSIAGKYIRPAEGTMEFALMYLPAENLHYRLLRDDDGRVMKECLRLHVLPVGPMSFFAYLQTISYGLKGLALPSEGKDLRRRISRLRQRMSVLSDPVNKTSTHLKNLNRSWEETARRLEQVLESLEDLETAREEEG